MNNIGRRKRNAKTNHPKIPSKQKQAIKLKQKLIFLSISISSKSFLKAHIVSSSIIAMGGAQALSLDNKSGGSISAATYESMGLEEYEIGEKGAPRIVWVVGSVLEKVIKKNEKMMKGWKHKDVIITAFHGTRPPSLSVHQYIDRIFRYSSCSPACFVVAYVYLERFLSRTAGFLTSLNVHRLLITSIMLAAKFLDDE